MGKLTEKREDGGWTVCKLEHQNLGWVRAEKDAFPEQSRKKKKKKMEAICPISLLSGRGVQHDIFKLLKVIVPKKTWGFFLVILCWNTETLSSRRCPACLLSLICDSCLPKTCHGLVLIWEGQAGGAGWKNRAQETHTHVPIHPPTDS